MWDLMLAHVHFASTHETSYIVGMHTDSKTQSTHAKYSTLNIHTHMLAFGMQSMMIGRLWTFHERKDRPVLIFLPHNDGATFVCHTHPSAFLLLSVTLIHRFVMLRCRNTCERRSSRYTARDNGGHAS